MRFFLIKLKISDDELQLSEYEYIIVGGGALAVRNMREIFDIDIVVTPKRFEKLKNDPAWIYKIRPNGKPKLYNHVAKIYLDVNTESFSLSTNELFKHADIFHGIQCIDLYRLAEFKKHYGLMYATLGEVYDLFNTKRNNK
ncbi:zinc ABC transporter substrate-binding protein [Acinetobacter rathckeae]|uniref:zinc ABC transporter substrate-binding protein n=1 Tax=Acinetobacter rathckeae TaxID=2605272 RepID=UPI0018A2AC05|nr:zinc ABC transporter substrate-binding protein [Acinetobacter rathckeae]MBF7687142.1 zinc ABC transporter substrate-binding protein [Acinetobacter rathckeae]MBF7694506.1 zinc ABC transporter substrate-binding protein [Acinetobacter rathckeae]